MKWRIIGCRVDYVGLPGHWACAATVEWVDAKNKSRTSKVECSASQYWEARELLGELLGGSCPAWFETAAPAWVAEAIGGVEGLA